MPLFKRERREEVRPSVVQLRQTDRHPFRLVDGYVPLHQPEFSLYRSIREAIPVVDAAILKLVRLTGGVWISCRDKGAEGELNEFLRTVPAGWNQKGIQAFLDCYLDCLLTCGRAVGEIVPSRDGREIAAVLCGNVSDIEVKEQGSPLDILLAVRRPDGTTGIMPTTPLEMESVGKAPTKPAGKVGEHTVEILKSLGYPQEKIDAMIEDGSVAIESQMKEVVIGM